jgi:PAS domain S-box-containing protein
MALKIGTPHAFLAGAADAEGEVTLRAAFLDALGEAVVATDLDGRILYWNAAATRLFGWSADEVLGTPAHELLLAEGTDREAALVLERLRRRGRWSGDLLVRHRDGRVFPVLTTATTARDADGNPVGMVGLTRDNSIQRKAEETARDAQERVELVHRAASTLIWEWDVASGQIKWSDVLEDMFGYDPARVEPSLDWWRERIHPEDRPRVVDGFERFLREDRRFWTDEYRFLTADRGYAAVFGRAFMAYDAEARPVRVVGTLIDLTERRRLHEEQRFLSQASMILELSLDYESTLPTIARMAVNSMADACLLAVTAGEGFPPVVTAAHADPRLQAVAEEAAAYLAHGPPADSILENVVRGGESVLVPHVPEHASALVGGDTRLADIGRALSPRSVMVVPLRARRAVFGYGIFLFASQERCYDETDLGTAEELGRRIGLTVDHARLFQSAELANRAKSDFLAIISHELRTPLTAVLGYADLLREEVAGPLNAAQHRQVDRIRAGSDRLLRLIEGILAFARLETGRERAQLDAVRVADLLRHVEDMVRPSASEKGIDFRIQVDQVPDTIHADAERFAQVILSLLTNAIKFTDQGEVRLRAWAEAGVLRVDVSDSGKGIAPEHLPQIFNPFWQAEHPTTRRSGGAGLGLSIARRLARLMNGDVLVAETSPKGTTFRFELPVR